MRKIIGKIKLFVRKIQSLCLLRRVYVDFKDINSFYQRERNVRVISLVEHIGDIVACEPIARCFKEQDKDVKIVWIVNNKYRELLEYNPNVDKYIAVDCLSEWIYLKFFLQSLSKIALTDLHMPDRLCSKFYLRLSNPNEKNITIDNYYEHGALLNVTLLIAGLPCLDLAPQMYLSAVRSCKLEDLPKHYIVIQTTSNEKCRNWQIDKWCELIQHYREYTFIEVGLSATIKGIENCDSHFCGKTTLLEVAQIIQGADLFIGVDSAFAHFANALSIPGVILLGKYKNFERYIPYTGSYANGINAEIIHYHEIVAKLPVSMVCEAVDRIRNN